MKRRKHTPEQIIRKLREAEQMLSEGKTMGEEQRPWGSPSRPCTAGETPTAG